LARRLKQSAATRGLSLLELIVGLFLLSLLILFIFNLYPTVVFASRQSEDKTRADHVAQTYLNRLRAQPFEQLELGIESERIEVDGVPMDVQVEVRRVANSEESVLKSCLVTVEWESRSGPKKRVHEVWVSHVRR
jgi:type II secretory pathway component PulJ